MQAQLRERIHALSRKMIGLLVLEGIVQTLLVLLAFVGLSVVLDAWLELSRPVRMLVLFTGLGATAFLFRREVLVPLRMAISPLDIAYALDRRGLTTGFIWRVAAILELPGVAGRGDDASPALIERAVHDSFRSLPVASFDDFIDRRRARMARLLLIVSIAAPVLMAAMSPIVAGRWAQRWLLARNVPWPRSTTLSALDSDAGRIVVPRGEPTTLRFRAADARGEVSTIWLTLRGAQFKSTTTALPVAADGLFRYDLPPLKEPIQAWVRGGDARLGPLTIEPHDRPRLVDLRAIYPQGQGKPDREHTFTGGDGDLVLRGETDVTLRVTADRPLASATLAGAKTTLPLEWTDDRTATAKWTHRHALQVNLNLIAAGSNLSSHPLPISIGVHNDREPRVTLRHTGVRLRLSPQARVPLVCEARDDFGLTSLSIAARPRGPAEPPTDDAPPSVTIPATLDGQTTNAVHETTLDIDAMKMSVGDLLDVYGIAQDEAHPTPQTTRSTPLIFRIVAPEELMRDVLLRQQSLRADFRVALKDMEDMQGPLAAAILPGDAAQLFRRIQLIHRKVWRVRRGIEDVALEMQLNRLGGPEAHAFMDRYVVAPLRRLDEQAMAEHRDAIEALKHADKDQLPQRIEQHARIIAQMKELLAQMDQWDSFIDVVNQLNEVIRLQEATRNQVKTIRDKQVESIFSK